MRPRARTPLFLEVSFAIMALLHCAARRVGHKAIVEYDHKKMLNAKHGSKVSLNTEEPMIARGSKGHTIREHKHVSTVTHEVFCQP